MRAEYRGRVEEAEQVLQQLHLERSELQQEERQWLRRRLLLVEKDRVIELFRQGVLGQTPTNA